MASMLVSKPHRDLHSCHRSRSCHRVVSTPDILRCCSFIAVTLPPSEALLVTLFITYIDCTCFGWHFFDGFGAEGVVAGIPSEKGEVYIYIYVFMDVIYIYIYIHICIYVYIYLWL